MQAMCAIFFDPVILVHNWRQQRHFGVIFHAAFPFASVAGALVSSKYLEIASVWISLRPIVSGNVWRRYLQARI
jgi:hypothetical protein